MIIRSEQASGPCDDCGNGTASHGALSQGATGRWCEVMWLCRECAIKWAGGEDKITPIEEARAKCREDGYPDF